MKMRATRVLLPCFVAVCLGAAVACGDDGGDDGGVAPTATRAGPTAVPGADERVTLRGMLTLDGEPLVTQFLGARVVRDDGLVAACQAEIPAVIDGEYEIEVVADAEVRGCGAPGAEILLWAYIGDGYVFSSESAPWPEGGGTSMFDASFSSAAPAGATKPVTELKGLLFDRDGSDLPGGSVVEAYVGETLCGVTSLRYGDVTEGYYTLIVAGPNAVPGCEEGATITFRVDGQPAAETAVNDLGRSADANEREVNLTQE
jgi:hypothetical protein